MRQVITNSRNKSIAFLVIFIGMVLFQLTEFRYIWEIESVSRFYNVVFLLAFGAYITIKISVVRLSAGVWVYYLIPGLLVFTGFFVNITINTFRDLSLAINYGSLIPWVVYLAIPFLLKDNIIGKNKILQYYYISTLLIAIFGLLDYFLYFNNIINLRVLNHPNGIFLSGWFSILHMLEDGYGHYRFYASIGEAGNLAMILIPSLIYSVLYKKYLGIIVFIVSIYLTDSLGAFISIGIILLLLSILLYRRYKFSIFAPILSTIIIVVVVAINWGDIYKAYIDKGDARVIREENVRNSINNIPPIIINNPIGINFTKDYSKNTSKEFYGTNFTILNAIYKGGVVSGIGYISILIVFFLISASCFYRKNIRREDIFYSLSIIAILPFIVQRDNLLETPMLILIIAPYVVSRLGIVTKKNYRSID